MIDLSVQLSQPTLQPQIWRAFSLQRQIVDDWYQSMDAWRMRRVNGVGATLNLASALSSTRRPQAAIGLVVLATTFGSTRIVDVLVGDPLPRIC